MHSCICIKINKVEDIPLDNNKNDECSICFKQMVKEITLLKCGHCYHKDCIEKWYTVGMKKGKNTCPLCRAEFNILLKRKKRR